MSDISIGSGANIIDKNGILWLSEFCFNSLFKVNLNCHSVEWVTKFDGFSVNEVALHSDAYDYKDEIIFIPFNDKKVRIYNKKRNIVESVSFLEKDEICFLGKSLQLQDSIFFISSDFVVWEYIFQEKKVRKDFKITELLKKYFEKTNGELSISVYSNGFLFWERGGKRGYQIDIVSKNVKFLNVKIEDDLDRVLYNDGQYWFTLVNSFDVIAWDGANTYCIYKANQNEWLTKKHIVPYYDIYHIGGELILTNYYGRYIMKVNKEKKCLEKLFDFPSDFKVLNKIGYGPAYTKLYVREDNLIFVPQRGNLLLIYNLQNKDVSGYEMKLLRDNVEGWEEILSKKHELLNKIEVKDENDLSDFIEIVGLLKMNDKKNNKAVCGEAIYSQINMG